MERTENTVLGYSILWQKETKSLNKFYKNSDSPVKKYILLTGEYVKSIDNKTPIYEYSELFRQVLCLCEETFRPDAFQSYFTDNLIELLQIEFMDWLLSHKDELKRLLTWNQVCELQCNYRGWYLNNTFCLIPDKSLKQMWNYSDEKQTEDFIKIISAK